MINYIVSLHQSTSVRHWYTEKCLNKYKVPDTQIQLDNRQITFGGQYFARPFIELKKKKTALCYLMYFLDTQIIIAMKHTCK